MKTKFKVSHYIMLAVLLSVVVPVGMVLASTVPAMAEPTGPSVSTDKLDYAPEETVVVSGSGFDVNSDLLVKVIRPDGSVVKGDGSFTPGSDTVTADSTGSFTYQYILDGVEGTYTVEVLAGDTVLATTTFTDSSQLVSVSVGSQTGTLTSGTAGSATYTVTVTRTGSGLLEVILSNSTLPAGASATFTPNSFRFTGNTPTSNTSTLTITTSTTTPAGTTTFTVTAVGDTTKTATGTLTINPAPAGKSDQTIAFGPLVDKTYGDADFGVSATATSGLPVSFTASGNCSITGSTVHITGAGSCTITANQSGNASYNAAPDVSQSFTVGKATASVTPIANGKIYGAGDPALTGTLAGFLPADAVTATYSRTTGETVGGSPYTISATLLPTEVLGNYDITYNTAVFTITPKAASVTPNAASKTFHAADPTLTGTLTGFLPADGVTATYTRTSGEAVGTYTISATLSPTGVLGNYAITYNTAVFTINNYVFGGFGPPLMISRTNYKQTSTIPVKFKLFDNSGNPVSYAVATLTVNGVNASSSGGSNTGNLFRYDSSGKQYIFNLTTKPLVIGVNTLTVTLDDGKSYSWTITLR